jgi:deoxyhypusine synthase
MTLANQAPASAQAPPSDATDAVLKPSEAVPADAKEVQGIDFNDYAQRSITVEELMAGYARMGFQATAIGEAVRIVNDMVSAFPTARGDPGRSGCGHSPGSAPAKLFSRKRHASNAPNVSILTVTAHVEGC